MNSFFSNKWVISIASLLIGVVAFVAIRFVWQPNPVHYHANFAVFINGQREQFKGTQYYQEVALCSVGTTPQSRVHMHDNIDHVVHVHDAAQTWSQFFTNLGWSLGDTLISNGETVYQDGNGGHFTIILNGHQTRSIANEVIRDKDRLLISFGNEDAAGVQRQFDQVESDAIHYDEAKDPASCSGAENSWQTRLMKAIWF